MSDFVELLETTECDCALGNNEKTLEQVVEAKFTRFMKSFPYHQRREVRAILGKLP